MDRIILHSDINSCYASIEHVFHPELQGKPVAVGGSVEARHGIILAKDDLAKKCGVKTGMAIWQAMLLCPELNVLPPRMDLYLSFSKQVQDIYSEYTNLREPFGIDESWLDLTGCVAVKDGESAAREINRRVKKELGVTVSVGVSWNKVFAKLGSDYRKPDAVTSISRENFTKIVWPLPVEDLLYVGRATSSSLRSIGINTIGELARSSPDMLKARLGKMGYIVHAFANGLDTSPVRREDLSAQVKSISNSTTTPRDLLCDEDVRITLMALAESVSIRLRKGGFRAQVISVSVRRSSDLAWNSHQIKLRSATDITQNIFLAGMELFRQLHVWPAPIRSLGLSCSCLESADAPEQLDLFGQSELRQKQRSIDAAMDSIRSKYGFASIKRGLAGADLPLGSLNAVDDHIVHPIGFFGGH